MVKILRINLLGIKGKTIYIPYLVVDIHDFKRSRSVVTSKRFPGQLLSLGQFRREADDHILHGHKCMENIAFSGSICTVNGKHRKQSSLFIRMNQAGLQRLILGCRKTDHRAFLDGTMIFYCKLNEHMQIPPGS